VGVGGVVIDNERALLIRRGGPPMEGQWSIPGGMLELGETMKQGRREGTAEETGLEVDVLDIIEVLERIFPRPGDSLASLPAPTFLRAFAEIVDCDHDDTRPRRTRARRPRLGVPGKFVRGLR